MGLQQAIGYDPGSRGWWRSRLLLLIGTRPGSWLVARMAPPLDSAVHKTTRGRYTASSVIGGLPVIMLTTTGARSGRPRTHPLVGIPVGDDLAVIGSNFGQARHPGWVHNLRANPNATVSFRDRAVTVTARHAIPDEHEQAFRTGARLIPAFRDYRERVTGREIEVFVLSVAGV